MSERVIEVPNEPDVSSDCPAGWVDIVNQCIEDLVEIDPALHIIQIKEKLGLRMYVSLSSGAPSQARVTARIGAAETEAARTCGVCGRLGTMLPTFARPVRCGDHLADQPDQAEFRFIPRGVG